jgi:hypothetical protein
MAEQQKNKNTVIRPHIGKIILEEDESPLEIPIKPIKLPK